MLSFKTRYHKLLTRKKKNNINNNVYKNMEKILYKNI